MTIARQLVNFQTLGNLSNEALYLVATLPEEERAKLREVEKRVEVPPADYYSLKHANESLADELLKSHEKIQQVEYTKSLLETRYKLLESESREAKELKEQLNNLTGKS